MEIQHPKFQQMTCRPFQIPQIDQDCLTLEKYAENPRLSTQNTFPDNKVPECILPGPSGIGLWIYLGCLKTAMIAQKGNRAALLCQQKLWQYECYAILFI